MWCFSEVLKSCCNFNKPPDVTASVLKLQIFSQDITRRLKLEFYDAGRLLGLKTNRCSRKTNPPLHRRIPNQLLSPAGVFSPARHVISLPAADINSTFSRSRLSGRQRGSLRGTRLQIHVHSDLFLKARRSNEVCPSPQKAAAAAVRRGGSTSLAHLQA